MRARPRVAYVVSDDRKSVFDRFEAALAGSDCPCSGSVGRQEVTLHICDRRRKPWSPWLQLRVESDDRGTLLLGTMGPQPNLWTAYVFVYACLVAAFIAGSMYGFVQTTLGDTPTGFLATAAATVGLAVSCSLDLAGRRVGQGQMGIIRGFVTRTIPSAIEIDESEVEAPLRRTAPV